MSEFLTSVASLAGLDVNSPASLRPQGSSKMLGAGAGSTSATGMRKSFANQYQRARRTPIHTEVESDDGEEEEASSHGTPATQAGTAGGGTAFPPPSEMLQQHRPASSTGAVQQQQSTTSTTMAQRSSFHSRPGARPAGISLPGPVMYQPPSTPTGGNNDDPNQQMRPASTSPAQEVGGMTRTGSGVMSANFEEVQQGPASGNFTQSQSAPQFSQPIGGATPNSSMSRPHSFTSRAGGASSGGGGGGGFYASGRSLVPTSVPPLALTPVGAGALMAPAGLQAFSAQARGQGSARSSMMSFGGVSAVETTRTQQQQQRQRRPCANILVLGSRQVGKSAFANAYRAVNTASSKWPIAPVGMCGRHGTTAVDPCPNNSVSPNWILVDTPGKVYAELHGKKKSNASSLKKEKVTPAKDKKPREEEGEIDSSDVEVQGDLDDLLVKSPLLGTDDSTTGEGYDGDDAILLQMLFEGLPWKTRLVGPKAASVAKLSELPESPDNRAHQAVIVISATDILNPVKAGLFGGWFSSFGAKLETTPQLDSLRNHLADFLEYVRVLLGDRAPFIVVTHMDSYPPTWQNSVEARIKMELKECVPLNRVYFLTLPSSAKNAADTGGSNHATPAGSAPHLTLAKQMEGIAPSDPKTRTQLLKLHHDLQADLAWFYKTSGSQQQQQQQPPTGGDMLQYEQQVGGTLQNNFQREGSGFLNRAD